MPVPAMLGSEIDIVEGFPAVDLNTAGNNGDYINMKNVAALIILVRSGVGTAGQDFTIDIQQAKDNGGTSVKALSPSTSPVKVWRKQAATDLSAVTSWTDASGDVSTAAITNTDNAEQSTMYAVEIHPEELDVANSFTHVRAKIDDDMTNAMPGDMLYIVKPMYPGNPDDAITYLD